jgi:hypothetical protein
MAECILSARKHLGSNAPVDTMSTKTSGSGSLPSSAQDDSSLSWLWRARRLASGFLAQIAMEMGLGNARGGETTSGGGGKLAGATSLRTAPPTPATAAAAAAATAAAGLLSGGGGAAVVLTFQLSLQTRNVRFNLQGRNDSAILAEPWKISGRTMCWPGLAVHCCS